MMELTTDEVYALEQAATDVVLMAREHASKRPKMTTLVEEHAEAVLAARGKHDDPLELELLQIASVCVNLVWQIRTGVDVANLRTER